MGYKMKCNNCSRETKKGERVDINEYSQTWKCPGCKYIVDIEPEHYLANTHFKVTEVPHNAIEPKHYTDLKISPLDYITENEGEFTWCIANVIKYVSRYKRKNGLEDLKKAKWYLEHQIKLLEANNDSPTSSSN